MPSADQIGRYRVEKRLGSGAFAVVWLAHDDRLEAPVAVKVMSENWAYRMDIRERFLAEARLLRKASSAGVVQVFDVGELEDERPYFVMEYADQGTVADRMAAGPLPVAEALHLTAEAARGVRALHEAGVVHRDIKPSNVLLAGGGRARGRERVLVADLGLAKNLAQASGLTVVAGSAGYMAPEQAEPFEGIDGRADVYSLGAVLYHLVTGAVPGPPGRVVPLTELRPGLPAALEETVERAMEPSRERRWPTAGAFANALDRLAETVADEYRYGPERDGPDDGGRAFGAAAASVAGSALPGRSRAGGDDSYLDELDRSDAHETGFPGHGADRSSFGVYADSVVGGSHEAGVSSGITGTDSGETGGFGSGTGSADSGTDKGEGSDGSRSEVPDEEARERAEERSRASRASGSLSAPTGPSPSPAPEPGAPLSPSSSSSPASSSSPSSPSSSSVAEPGATPGPASGSAFGPASRTGSGPTPESASSPASGPASGPAPGAGFGPDSGSDSGSDSGAEPAPAPAPESAAPAPATPSSFGAGSPHDPGQGSAPSPVPSLDPVLGRVPEPTPAPSRRGRGRTLLALCATVAVLAGAGAAGVVLTQKRAPEPDDVRVRDESGRLSVRIPVAWAKESMGAGWSPAALGLPAKRAPGLLVAQDTGRWQDLTSGTSGVFVGLGASPGGGGSKGASGKPSGSTDGSTARNSARNSDENAAGTGAGAATGNTAGNASGGAADGNGANTAADAEADPTSGKLADMVAAIDHRACEYSGSRSFEGGGWRGRIRAWSSCDSPGHSLEEIALTPRKKGKPPVYVQIRCDEDCSARTDKVLGSIRVDNSPGG
ncbi:protein kinase [Streptomyces albus subsp. chlorinus]|uniref:protein kinase domain-containing protein n=1 Tax=Streptomyces albus TaxID=1888 RepID=UPI00191E1D52